MITKPLLSFVVAMDRSFLIGVGGELPWHLPEDMKHFRKVTMGKPVLMGRKTYESIPKRFRPLAGRTNIVLTRQQDFQAPGCLVVHSLDEALSVASGQPELMVIGGAQLYEQLLPLAQRLYLTSVDAKFKGDVFFPKLNMNEWQEISRQEYSPNEKHAVPFTIFVLDRLPGQHQG